MVPLVQDCNFSSGVDPLARRTSLQSREKLSGIKFAGLNRPVRPCGTRMPSLSFSLGFRASSEIGPEPSRSCLKIFSTKQQELESSKLKSDHKRKRKTQQQPRRVSESKGEEQRRESKTMAQAPAIGIDLGTTVSILLGFAPSFASISRFGAVSG